MIIHCIQIITILNRDDFQRLFLKIFYNIYITKNHCFFNWISGIIKRQKRRIIHDYIYIGTNKKQQHRLCQKLVFINIPAILELFFSFHRFFFKNIMKFLYWAFKKRTTKYFYQKSLFLNVEN